MWPTPWVLGLSWNLTIFGEWAFFVYISLQPYFLYRCQISLLIFCQIYFLYFIWYQILLIFHPVSMYSYVLLHYADSENLFTLRADFSEPSRDSLGCTRQFSWESHIQEQVTTYVCTKPTYFPEEWFTHFRFENYFQHWSCFVIAWIITFHYWEDILKLNIP
jgi:hypothetical protein